jgi:hypothetical protein
MDQEACKIEMNISSNELTTGRPTTLGNTGNQSKANLDKN